MSNCNLRAQSGRPSPFSRDARQLFSVLAGKPALNSGYASIAARWWPGSGLRPPRFPPPRPPPGYLWPPRRLAQQPLHALLRLSFTLRLTLFATRQIQRAKRTIKTAAANFMVNTPHVTSSKISSQTHTYGEYKNGRVAVISAKNHKRQRRKRQSVTAKREKSQTPKVLTAILILPNLT